MGEQDEHRLREDGILRAKSVFDKTGLGVGGVGRPSRGWRGRFHIKKRKRTISAGGGSRLYFNGGGSQKVGVVGGSAETMFTV